MFRHAHSVKGMASSMGFEAIATLAHRVEDLVDAVRAKPDLLTREMVDLLLAATDTLQGQVRSVGENRPLDGATALLAEDRRSVRRTDPRAPPTPPGWRALDERDDLISQRHGRAIGR
jgi:two-component system chemotaxis sensor kinase CheA